MSRLFDGVDDVMTFPCAEAMNDAFTLLIVCRIIVTSDTTWLSLLEGESSGSAVRCALGRRNDGTIYYVNSNGIISGGSITDSDNWMIVAVTRSTGAGTSVHKLPIGGARTTTALGALADGLTIAAGHFHMGGNDDFANIRVAAWARWSGTELTTGQLDGILSAKTTQSIADLSPTALYDDSDAFATDLIGTQDRSAITGTADDADDPSGWVYGLGGGPTTYFGATSLSLTVASTTVAKITAKAAAAVALTVGVVTAAQRTLRSSTTLTMTVARATVGKLTARSAASVTETVGRVTAAVVKMLGQVSRSETVTVTTAGAVPSGTHFGAATATFTVATTTAAKVTARSSLSVAESVSSTSTGNLTVRSSVSRDELVTVTTAATGGAGQVLVLEAGFTATSVLEGETGTSYLEASPATVGGFEG